MASDDRAEYDREDGREIPQRCETDGCHRKATLRLVYEVYDDGLNDEIRGVCQPCANAMRFRETFARGSDCWQAEEVRSRGE